MLCCTVGCQAETSGVIAAVAQASKEGQELIALNPKKKIPFKLVDKIQLSHNSRLFRFALQSPKHKLGLPVGQHMFFYCKVSPP